MIFFLLYLVYESLCFFFFFFQAEDGIRDHCVTGVQTCALPILYKDAAAYMTITQADGGGITFDSVSDGTAQFTFNEIGRASCRERV